MTLTRRGTTNAYFAIYSIFIFNENIVIIYYIHTTIII